MSDPEPTPIAALAAIVQSPEFAAVRAAVDALDPLIMLEPAVSAHLGAFRTGMTALAAAPALQPAQESEGEPEGDGGEEEPPAE
ncbi:MAG: hypothetical protein J0I69_02700 [Altererythrobacter sp.]|nr:hypothetical protein [Altererythrobacter sp.]OJU60929.1 MAG: hypothetical protein BGO08_12450 [Altererythrobacter sp. 66-12]